MPVLQTSEQTAAEAPASNESDAVLLGRFNAGDADAFRELVARHLHWVYASARQQVCDKHLAEDVTQTVFVILARKARALQGELRLSPWLFKVTRYTSLQAMRAARRRTHPE